MSLPSVNETEIDGGLGVVSSTDRVLACVGVSSLGPKATPTGYRSKPALQTDFGVGPNVELACRAIDRGLTAIIVRSEQTTDGAMGTIDDSHVTGTAITFITHTASTKPLDDYQVRVLCTTGGTLGTTGIVYQVSFDGGRTYGPKTALGTDLIIAPANTGVSFTITTGKTLVAGDYWAVTTTAPASTASDATAALTSLRNTSHAWRVAALSFPVDGTIFDAVDAVFASMSADGKPRAYLASFRIPTDIETEAAYKTAFDSAFGAKATVYGSICAGAAQVSSSINGRAYRRPTVFATAPRTAEVLPHIDSAGVDLGPLPGVSLTDGNGNPVYHDESINPGLDDSRACVLRTWGEPQGAYVNIPRIMAPTGSDFDRMMFRRVMNEGRIALRAFLIRRLNKSIQVSAKTGFILETVALEIEAGGRAAVRAILGSGPMVSDIQVVVHRDDNLLSTKNMHADLRLEPLAYVETITETAGFVNPANA